MEPTVDIKNTDCITGMAAMPAESVHLIVTSIPFEELFTYSGKVEDVGNNGSTVNILAGRFALNMRFVAEQMIRVLAPGCNACIHIQQLLAYKVQHGFAGRRDFRGAMVDVFGAAGLDFFAEVAIPKNPQAMANRLNLHSLQFKTGHSRTSTNWGMAPNDYVLVFQKPGNIRVPVRPLVYRPGRKPIPREIFDPSNQPPVTKYLGEDGENWDPHFWDDYRRGDEVTVSDLDDSYVRYLREWGKANKALNAKTGWISADDWIKWACGDWPDILEIDVLENSRSHKEEQRERHVCPLQLEVIRRCVDLYTNPATLQPESVVLDPFMGIGSTAWTSIGAPAPLTKFRVVEPRNVVGFELKESYHAGALANVAKARQLLASGREPAVSLYDFAEATA